MTLKYLDIARRGNQLIILNGMIASSRVVQHLFFPEIIPSFPLFSFLSIITLSQVTRFLKRFYPQVSKTTPLPIRDDPLPSLHSLHLYQVGGIL